jgi:hypothetical protein
MGLDASVMCNCWKLGLAREPPFPRDHLETDQDGYLNLRPEFDTKEYWTPFWDWSQTCCAHEGMDYASEHIANWSGYRLFQEALEKAGWHQFPVLGAELPNANGGRTNSTQAKLALAELEIFRQLPSLGQNAALVDHSGFVIFEFIASYEGVFILSGPSGVDVGVAEFEFFIRDRHTGVDLFRARRVRQTLIDPRDDNRLYEGRVEFQNLDTETVCITTVAVSGRTIPWPDGQLQNDNGQFRCEYPEQFQVEMREVLPSHFDYIVNPLLRIFQASVTTGNPVRWC